MTDSEIINQLMRITPHGSLLERLSWLVSETVRQEQVIEKLEFLLTQHEIPLPE